MKIYDCFTFYNEFELLELRLKALWDVVDYFVLVEADRTHTNKPKPFYFYEYQDDFKEFLPKLRFIPAYLSNLPYKGTGDWSIENFQRNAIMNGLVDAQPDDLIMISDMDEIPEPDVLKNLDKTPLIDHEDVNALDMLNIGWELAMSQKFFYYYFDLISKVSWQGTTLIKRSRLKTPQHLRLRRNKVSRVGGGITSLTWAAWIALSTR
ncbi:MAG: hypothetical protein SR1Q7_06070 [Quinella sp. 1Q7]|nr:hypothetical protein [Quinella sp. 1Q7]